MYGYIYRTVVADTGEIYIGQKKSDVFIPGYHGSGKIIRDRIDTYGTKAMLTSMLIEASSAEDLDELEKKFIQIYKDQYGDRCINMALGGAGGDGFHYASEDDITSFIEKMTEINRTRCQTDEFRESTGKRMRQLYTNPEERKKQSERVRDAWNNKELRKAQSDRMKKQWELGLRNADKNKRSCIFDLNGRHIVFDSQKALKKFLKDEYNMTFANPDLKRMLNEGKPYHPFHKNKGKALDGMVIRWNEFFELKRRT